MENLERSPETTHTPGPWEIHIYEFGTSYSDGSFYVGGPGFCIAQRAPWPERAAESIANARLISAAPDLLAALKAARKFIGDCVPAHGEYVMPEIEAAIAKAEGR